MEGAVNVLTLFFFFCMAICIRACSFLFRQCCSFLFPVARQRRARRARSNRSKSESSATIPIDVPQGPLSEAQKQEMQQQILDELRKELQELNRKVRFTLCLIVLPLFCILFCVVYFILCCF